MRLTPADLDRIEALARKAGYGVGYDSMVYPGNIGNDLSNDHAALFAALNPDTVLALVEAARRGMMASAVIAYCPPEPEPADDDD